MSKISDLSSNNASGQLSNADLLSSPKASESGLAENQEITQTGESQSSTIKPNDLMAASSLINSTIQLRSDLSRKLDGNSQANKTNDAPDDEKPGRKNNSSSRNGKKVLSKLSESATDLQIVKQELRKQAAQAGLSTEAQNDFVEEHAQKFLAQPENQELRSLLEKAGDLSLLKSDNSLAPQPYSETQLLSAKVEEGNSNLSAANFVTVNFEQNVNPNQSANLEKFTNLSQIVNLDQPANLKQAANSKQAINLNPAGLETEGYSGVSGFGNSVSQKAVIEGRFPAPNQSPREFENLAIAIQKKVEEVLQKLGLGSEQTNTSGTAKSVKELHLVSEFLDAQKSLGAKDKALFATAFGVATESSSKSRERHGDGVLLEFANYGDKAIVAGKEANQMALAKFLQHGTQAGYQALLKSVDSDFSPAALKSVEQIKQKLGADKTSNLVVGVVTMSVMTREVVAQLNHVTVNSALGLSDNALAALQKAHNSLRDHLTPTDIVGAVGNLKNTPVEIEGARYNFLPEVNEALNSLREARSRILSETMYLKSDAGGTDAQQRFVREAENLFGITERIESILGV